MKDNVGSNRDKEHDIELMYAQIIERYQANDLGECLKKCSEFLQLSQKNNMTELSGRIYGVMGVVSAHQDNEIQALDYFLKALDIKLMERDHLPVSKLYSNIAVLYLALQDCDMAQQCLEQSEYYANKYREEHGTDNDYKDWHARLLTNRCLQYCRNGDYQKAIQCKWKLDEYQAFEETKFVRQFVHVLNAMIAYRLDLYDEFIKSVKEVIAYKDKIESRYEIYEEYLELFMFLVEKNEIALANEFLDMIQLDEEIMESGVFVTQYYDAMMGYYKLIHDDEKLNDLYEAYFNLIQKRKSERMQSKFLNLKTKQMLHEEFCERKQVENEVKRLKEKSEHDALTGLANRYLFNEYCDKYFNESVKNHSSFGVLIIDIDYFKEYNDTYGHIEGDRCIKMVADCIKDAADGCFCARYGGDEFFIIDSEITEGRLQKIAADIQNQVLSLKMPHPKNTTQPYVTVSQGICIASPVKEQSYMEFVHEADMALYRGKKMNRNAIVMGTV